MLLALPPDCGAADLSLTTCAGRCKPAILYPGTTYYVGTGHGLFLITGEDSLVDIKESFLLV